METLLLRVRTSANSKLDDDQYVEECMARLLTKYPSLAGYTYERTGPEYIQILVWGDITIVT